MELDKNKPTVERLKTYAQSIKDGAFRDLPDDYEPPLWDPENDPNWDLDETVMFLGQRRSGKSTMAAELALKNRRLYPIVFVFTGTKHNGFWQQIVPDDKVIEGLDESLLEQMLNVMKERTMLYKQQKAEDGSAKGNPYVLLINEDLLTSGELRKSKAVRIATFNGRHYYLCSWTLVQDFIGMDRAERKSLDRFIIFRAYDPGTRALIRDTWGEKVLMIFDRVTSEPYQALIINNKTGTPKDQVLLRYKADKDFVDASFHKNLKLGNEALWEGVDLEEQKKMYPIIKMPSNATLAARFNEKVGDDRDLKAPEEPDKVSLDVIGGDQHKLHTAVLKETLKEEEAKKSTGHTMWQ